MSFNIPLIISFKALSIKPENMLLTCKLCRLYTKQEYVALFTAC